MYTSQNIYFFLLIFVTLLIYSQQQLHDPAFMESFHKYELECAKEGNIDLDVVHKAWKENHFPSDNNFKCYFKCLNLKLGVINEKGDVVDEVLKKVSDEFVDNAQEREIVTECGAIEGTDLCETSFKLIVCIKAAILD